MTQIFGAITMLIKSLKFWTSILGILLFLPICQATTLIVIVTPQGIVVGADQRLSDPISDASFGTVTKLFLIQGHLVVSSSGMYHLGRGYITAYDFPAWIARVEEGLASDVTVDDLASEIENKSAGSFHDFDDVIHRGFLKAR